MFLFILKIFYPMQRDFPEMEQTAFVIDYTSQIFKKIIKIFTFYEEIDKSLKKKENFVAFPFSFSFESSKSSSKNILKPTNFLKKRLMKNNTFSSISLLNNSNEMSNLFFKTHEDIISPHNLTERLFFQMEPDINYQKFIQKEYSSPFLEENLPNNSTIETENQQTNILEYQLKQIDEDKLLESVDDKDMIDFLANDLIKSKNFQNLGIEDEKIPNEAKNFQNIPKLIPFQQKNFFSDLDNSNITYIDESPLTITKKFKSHNVFTKNVVREGWFLRKTRNFMSGWEVYIYTSIFQLI